MSIRSLLSSVLNKENEKQLLSNLENEQKEEVPILNYTCESELKEEEKQEEFHPLWNITSTSEILKLDSELEPKQGV